MRKNEDIISEADYYLNNDVTMSDAANHFGICKKSFQVHMKKLEEICPDKYKLVNEKKEKNLIRGAIKGGMNGKPSTISNVRIGKSFSFDSETAVSLARDIIDKDLSFRQLEHKSGIPKSTIKDNLSKDRIGDELYEELSCVLDSHKPGNKRR